MNDTQESGALHLEEGDEVCLTMRETPMTVVSLEKTSEHVIRYRLENHHGDYELIDYSDDGRNPILRRASDRKIVGRTEVNRCA